MSHTSYQEKHRRYYESHREEIARKESEKKRWLEYYERNKEEIKRKREERKRGSVVPTAGTTNVISFFAPTLISV